MAVSIQPSERPNSPDLTASDDGGDVAITLQSVQIRVTPQVYTRRYAMLAMFGALGFLQCGIWNTWGPIASVVKIAYPRFTADQIAWLSLWAPLLCIFLTPIFMLLVQKKGLRIGMVISTFLMAVGCALRCLTMDPEYFALTAHACAILNGIAGIVVAIAPSLLSTLWFPLSSRTTATGFGCTMNQLGNAGGFFLGPYLVNLPDMTRSALHEQKVNAQQHMDKLSFSKCMQDNDCLDSEGMLDRLERVSLWSDYYPYGGEHYRVSPYFGTSLQCLANETLTEASPQLQTYLREQIFNYMVISAGLAAGLFVLVLAFFEDEPPTPPVPLVPATERRWTASLASTRRSRINPAPTTQRTISEIARLVASGFRNPSFLLMLFCYSLTLGINVAWTSVLDVNLEPLGVTMRESSWVGVFITFGGVFLAIIASRISDLMMECHKVLIILLLFLSTVCYSVFVMSIKRCFPFNMWVLQVSAILGGSFNYAVSPLFFELFMEIGHPAPEDVLGSVITIFWNTAGLVFLLIMGSQTVTGTVSSVIWMDYLLLAQAAVCCILMWFVKEEYKRSGAIMQDRLRESGRHVPGILEHEFLSCEFASESEFFSSESDITALDSDDNRDTHQQLRFASPSASTASVRAEVRLLVDSSQQLGPVSSSSSSSNSN